MTLRIRVLNGKFRKFFLTSNFRSSNKLIVIVVQNSIHSFSALISEIPVRNHSVRVRRLAWEERFEEYELSPNFADFFGERSEIYITRNQIHEQQDPVRKCLEVLLWGYPSGMRGNYHSQYLASIAYIAKSASENKDWPDYYSALKCINGVGLSTITKLAYFFGKTFGGHQALILDSRLITIFQKMVWPEFHKLNHLNVNNAFRHYLLFLQIICEISKTMNSVTPDQIEFFLFALGNSFAVEPSCINKNFPYMGKPA